MIKVIFALLLSCGLNSLAQAASCSITCSFSVDKLIGSKKMSGWDQNEVADFKAYCDDLGGTVRLGPGTCAGVNADNFQCIQKANLQATGSAYGSDLYETRQASRKNCKESLIDELGGNCTPYVSGSTSSILFAEPQCS